MMMGFCASLAFCAQAADLPSRSQEEARFVTTLNAFRLHLNLGTLKRDARLDEAARKHSEWMMNYNVLTHLGPRIGWGSGTRMMAEGVDPSTLMGENVARGSADAQETFRQWLFSPGHLLAMIAPEYDHIGVSRSDCQEEYECFWTSDFAQLNSGLESDREFLVEEVAQAAEKVLGPLGDSRTEISLDDEASPPSRWQRLKGLIKKATDQD